MLLPFYLNRVPARVFLRRRFALSRGKEVMAKSYLIQTVIQLSKNKKGAVA